MSDKYFEFEFPPLQHTHHFPVFAKVLDPEVCNKIIESFETKNEWQEGEISTGFSSQNHNENHVIRKTQLSAFADPEVTQTICSWINQVNTETYRFDIQGIPKFDVPNVMKYEDGGHYTYHLDIGPDLMSNRKLSFSILLSHPNDYDGGQLDFMPTYNIPREQGLGIVFPSFLLHRVTPVTRGVRHAIVGWVHGPHFK